MDAGWASRFYGMPVPPAIAAEINEHLTDGAMSARADGSDLVDAHLGINYAYFGAIDKTLSGFVILDDTGDDYTLYDLRDGQQVWFQDHETRDVELRHGGLADFIAKKPLPKGAVAKASRSVTTPALCARYQWLVWLLAKPLEQRGVPVQSIDYLVRSGIGRFRHTWPRREPFEAALEAELGELRTDPHLAVYWLLHTTVFADHERRTRVVEAIGPAASELVRAFVTRLAMLPLAGDVPVVPAFRARRAMAASYGAFELQPADMPRACLLALELDPATHSLVHGLQVASAIDKGLDAAAVTAVVERVPERTPGMELLRAVLDKRAGETASKHADELARLLPTIAEPWWYALEALWLVHELAYDGPALVAATRTIVARDRYHRRALQMAMRAAQMSGEPARAIDTIEADLAIADAVVQPFSKLAEHPREWQATVATLAAKPEAERALAWRVLQRAAINKPPPELAAWAAGKVVDRPEGVALVGEAFANLDRETQSGVVEAIAASIDRADHPLVEILVAAIEAPEPGDGDYAAQFQLKRAKEAALVALAPWFPALFDRLIALVEPHGQRPASGMVVDLFWAKLFSPFEKATYVLPKLSNAQAERVARAMVVTKLRHPNIHARNSAGHQLYRFSHRGAETYLIDALTEYGVRYAAVKGPGGLALDHGRTETDQLEDLVADIYAAIRNLGTPAARDALVERLFAERRSYWRMGNALGEIWDAELHTRIMALLAERRDPRAAGCYAYALHDFVKKGPPLVDLARMVREWQGDTELARGFLHYALVVGIDAALSARDYDLVRLAHENAAWISEPPIEPDAHARGRQWTNPLEVEATKAALADALSGKAEAARQALVAAATAARATGKPNLKITDEALGQLANAQVAERILHDRKTGEVWFRDDQHVLRYFDGYAVVAPPFTASIIGHDGAPSLANAFALAERATWWDAKASRFRDVMRVDAQLLLSWGINNGSFERYLIAFPDAATAHTAFAQLRANPPPKYTETDPFYLAGKGAIVRTYYARTGGEPERNVLAVYDGTLDGVDVGGEAAAIAEHQRRELAFLAGGGVMSCLEWMANRRRREDLTVREWINRRTRNDTQTPSWHVESLAEIAAYLDSYRIGAALETTIVAPAADADIAAYATTRTQPIPDSLRTLWLHAGGASWQLGERGARLLGPRDVIARRPIARTAGDAYLAKLTPAGAEQATPLMHALDVIVESLDGKPLTFLVDLPREDGRVFTHAADHSNDFWWEKSLSWMVATGLLGDLEDAIATAAPAIERLAYGQKAAGAAKKPAAKKPAAKKPAAKKQPVKKKPAAKKPAAKKPVKKSPARPKSKPKKRKQ